MRKTDEILLDFGLQLSNCERLSHSKYTEVFICKGQGSKKVCKIGHRGQLASEYLALTSLADIQGVNIPGIENYHEGNPGILITQYIGPSNIIASTQGDLGIMLAELHNLEVEGYGWASDNYIGALSQTNDWNQSWNSFWVENRIWPQLQLAKRSGYLSEKESHNIIEWFSISESIIVNLRPAILHGDLWNGNVVINSNGKPYLIDPSIYIGVGGVDIAMSILFGGFSRSFYEMYDERSFVAMPTEDEVRLYQLYYILVHLNMFGTSYLRQTLSCIKSIFNL